MSTSSQAIRDHVSLYLTREGKTQKELAESTGISRRQFYDKQSGRLAYTLDDAVAIKKVLGFATIDELLEPVG